MSERTDQKLQEVVVAQYVYRHEAEFAAGFLQHAEIPFRLQIDDPAMGFTISAPARIWVLGIDYLSALEVLDLTGEQTTSTSVLPTPVERRGPSPVPTDGALTMRERVLAVSGALGVIWMVSKYLAGGTSWMLSSALSTVAMAIFLAALVGRAPQPVKRLLSAIAGNAP